MKWVLWVQWRTLTLRARHRLHDLETEGVYCPISPSRAMACGVSPGLIIPKGWESGLLLAVDMTCRKRIELIRGRKRPTDLRVADQRYWLFRGA